jgi:hypothetical protein
MTAEELFLQPVGRHEGPSLDFKAPPCEKAQRYDFIKDVLAMANTRREGPSHIVLGVLHKAESGVQLIGLDHQVDDIHYTGLLGVDIVHPMPALQVIPVTHHGRSFGILQISISPDGPFLPLKKLGDALDEGEWWVHRGTTNVRWRPAPGFCGTSTSSFAGTGGRVGKRRPLRMI